MGAQFTDYSLQDCGGGDGGSLGFGVLGYGVRGDDMGVGVLVSIYGNGFLFYSTHPEQTGLRLFLSS